MSPRDAALSQSKQILIKKYGASRSCVVSANIQPCVGKFGLRRKYVMLVQGRSTTTASEPAILHILDKDQICECFGFLAPQMH
jgi:hypothetical protein